MTEPMPMPPPAKADEQLTRPVKSKGEKVFDRAVYAGIAGVGTFITTIIVADKLKFGSWNGFHKRVASKFERLANAIRPSGRIIEADGSKNQELAESAAMVTSLMMGGNLMLLPVGIAEQHKVSIVDGLNAAMGDSTPKEQIQQAPKQTWMSLAKSRGLAWVAVFGTLKGIQHYYKDTMISFERQTGDLFCRIMNKPQYTASTEVIGALKEEAKNFAHIGNNEALKKIESQLESFESKTYRYGKLGALDVFATIGAASLLYIGGHFFARKQEEKIEKRAEHRMVMGEPALRDVAMGDVVSKDDVPSAQIAGSKQHEGMAREMALSQQI